MDSVGRLGAERAGGGRRRGLGYGSRTVQEKLARIRKISTIGQLH